MTLTASEALKNSALIKYGISELALSEWIDAFEAMGDTHVPVPIEAAKFLLETIRERRLAEIEGKQERAAA